MGDRKAKLHLNSDCLVKDLTCFPS